MCSPHQVAPQHVSIQDRMLPKKKVVFQPSIFQDLVLDNMLVSGSVICMFIALLMEKNPAPVEVGCLSHY